MKRSSAVLVCILVATSTLFGSPTQIPDAAAEYPADTFVFVHCRDASLFLKHLAKTSLFRAIKESSVSEEATKYFEEIDGKCASEKRPSIFANGGDIDWFARNFLNGSGEFVCFPFEDEDHWILKVGLNKDNEIVKRLRAEFARNPNWSNVSLEAFEDQDKWIALADNEGHSNDESQPRFFGKLTVRPTDGFPSGECFVYWTESLFAASSSAKVLLDTLSKERPNKPKPRTLSQNRKFLELLNRLNRERIKASDLVFYVDSSKKIDEFLSGKKLDPEKLAMFRSIGLGEILSYGGKVSLDDARFEFQVELYSGLALPKSGISNIFDSKSLSNPVLPGVPADVDYYFSMSVNMRQFQTTIKEMQDARFGVRALMEIPDYFSQTLFKMLQNFWTAAAFSEQSVPLCTGEIDIFGSYPDDQIVQSARSTKRTFIEKGTSVIKDFLEFTPFGKDMIEGELDGHSYFRVSDVANQRMKDDLKKAGYWNAEKVATNIAVAEIEAPDKKYFASFPNMDSFSQSIGGAFETLDRDPNVEILWKELTSNEQPCFFAFVRTDAFFRPVFFYFTGRLYGAKNWLDAIKKDEALAIEHEKNLTKGDFQYRMNVLRAEAFDTWSREKFKSYFNCGAVGIYPTEKGLFIRIVQLR